MNGATQVAENSLLPGVDTFACFNNERIKMMNSITEKVVVITGASSGLGEATARLLSERGAKVVLAARRADRLENLAKDIKKAGVRH